MLINTAQCTRCVHDYARRIEHFYQVFFSDFDRKLASLILWVCAFNLVYLPRSRQDVAVLGLADVTVLCLPIGLSNEPCPVGGQGLTCSMCGSTGVVVLCYFDESAYSTVEPRGGGCGDPVTVEASAETQEP